MSRPSFGRTQTAEQTPFTPGQGMVSENAQSAILESRFIRRAVNEAVTVPAACTWVHRNPELSLTGNIVLEADAELYLL